jgi:hypothetical protein
MRGWQIVGLVGLAACGAEHVEPESNDAAAMRGQRNPRVGWWTEGEAVHSVNECGISEGPPDEVPYFELTMDDGARWFQMVYAEDEADGFPTTWWCTFHGDEDFSCDTVWWEQDFSVYYGLDALAVLAINASGTFSSDTEGVVDVSVDSSCTGADCAFLAPVDDCTSIAQYDIQWASDNGPLSR